MWTLPRFVGFRLVNVVMSQHLHATSPIHIKKRKKKKLQTLYFSLLTPNTYNNKIPLIPTHKKKLQLIT